MYPEIPYPGLSWPITQHSGVLSNEVLDGLLNAGLLCNGSRPDVSTINGYLIEHDILTANYRADSNQADAWRDYQQILSEFGFIYSTRVSREIKLTPIAMAYLNGRLAYRDVITLQIMRYQYPNGHKSQLSPSLIESYGTGIGKIERAYKTNQLQPEFETAKGVFRVTLPNRNEEQGLNIQPDSESEGDISLNEQKNLIIQYAQENGSITRKEVEDLIGAGTTKAFRLLKELCEANRLEQKGNGRLSIYVIK